MTELAISKIPTALEIAVLVKAVDLQDGAMLIAQYAHTMAAGAKIDAALAADERMDSLLRQFTERRPSREEFAETMDRVAETMETS